MMDVYYAGIDVSARTLDSALALPDMPVRQGHLMSCQYPFGASATHQVADQRWLIRPRVFRSHRTLQLGRGLGFTRASALRGNGRQP